MDEELKTVKEESANPIVEEKIIDDGTGKIKFVFPTHRSEDGQIKSTLSPLAKNPRSKSCNHKLIARRQKEKNRRKVNARQYH